MVSVWTAGKIIWNCKLYFLQHDNEINYYPLESNEFLCAAPVGEIKGFYWLNCQANGEMEKNQVLAWQANKRILILNVTVNI